MYVCSVFLMFHTFSLLAVLLLNIWKWSSLEKVKVIKVNWTERSVSACVR